MEGQLPAGEGLWVADAGFAAVADSLREEEKNAYCSIKQKISVIT